MKIDDSKFIAPLFLALFLPAFTSMGEKLDGSVRHFLRCYTLLQKRQLVLVRLIEFGAACVVVFGVHAVVGKVISGSDPLSFASRIACTLAMIVPVVVFLSSVVERHDAKTKGHGGRPPKHMA